MNDNRLSWNNAYPTTIEGAREGTALAAVEGSGGLLRLGF